MIEAALCILGYVVGRYHGVLWAKSEAERCLRRIRGTYK